MTDRSSPWRRSRSWRVRWLLWGWLKPAQPAVVTRVRTVLWDTPQIRAGFVGRRVAISPDGGTVVFMDSTAAGWQLWAKERDRLDATVVAGTADVAGAPTFSPDGAEIAFVTRDHKVKKVPRGGGAPVPIADSAATFLTLPRVAGRRQHPVRGRAVAVYGWWHRTAAPPASCLRDLLRPIQRAGGSPAWQACRAARRPCSQRVASVCGKAELRVLDLRTLKVTTLMPDVLAGWPLPGGLVAFVRKDGVVLAAPFDLRTLTFTRPPSPVMDGVQTSAVTADIAVSANGTMMYVAGAIVAREVFRYQPVWVTRTGTTTPIDTAWTVPLDGGSCTCDGAFALSPDGRRLALVIWRESVNSDINIKQLDQVPFALTPLTFAGDNWSPAWTADGRSVVYAGAAGDNKPGTSLLRRRTDGTGAVDTLLPASGVSFAEVVPTHDTATFILRKQTRSASRRDIVLARRGDTTTTPLIADSTFNEIFPALSPDGRWLAYASNETQGRYEVYVRPFPDVNSRRVQVSQGGGTEPRWAHSGRELFFRNAAGALVSATVVPAATFTQGSQSVLFEGSQFLRVHDEQSRSYDVAPGDQRFVFMREVVPAASTGPTGPPPMDRLVQVTNWAAEVQAKLAGKVPK